MPSKGGLSFAAFPAVQQSLASVIRRARTHRVALGLAILFSMLMILPFASFQWTLGSRYQGILPVFNDDELFYLARLNDVVEGHGGQGNAYLWERKAGPPLQVYLAEFVLGKVLSWIGMDAAGGRILFSALFPPLGFLLTYAILRRMGQSEGPANLVAAFLFFGLYCIRFNRPVSPQFNFLFWLLEYLLLLRLLQGDRGLATWLGAAATLGVLFNLYPYFWTHYAVWIVVLAGGMLLKRERRLAAGLAAVLGAGMLGGIPYFTMASRAGQLPYYWESLTRLGLVFTRFPSGAWILAWAGLSLVLFAAAWRVRWVRLDPQTCFHLAGIVACIVVVNQHLLTGLNLEFASHFLMQSVFTCTLALAHLWREARDQAPGPMRRLAPILSCVLGIVIVSGLAGYCRRALRVPEGAERQQRLSEPFAWIRKTVARDAVVLANAEISEWIPVYTAANVLYARNANLFLMPDEEVVERFVISSLFEEITEEFVSDHERSVFGVRHVNAYQHTQQINRVRRLLGMEPLASERLPRGAVTSVLQRDSVLRAEGLGSALRRFRLDFILWDKAGDPHWALDERAELVKVFDHPHYPIYRLRP